MNYGAQLACDADLKHWIGSWVMHDVDVDLKHHTLSRDWFMDHAFSS